MRGVVRGWFANARRQAESPELVRGHLTGGFDRGLERAGFTVVGQVEIDPFCQRVLAARWPGVQRVNDVRGYRREERSGEPGHHHDAPGEEERLQLQRDAVDLLVGGFPCQDLSVAGKRAGLGGERSGLFWEIVRIAKATSPTWGLFENVPGLVSSHRGSDMALVIAGLRECWPVVGWRILDSRYFGVAQRRRRVFFVCGPTEAGVAQVLALTEGGAGDPEAGGEAGPGTPGATPFSTLNSGGNNGGFRTEPGEHLVIAQCHGTNVGPMGTLRKGNGNVTGGVPFVAATLNPGHEAKHSYPGDGGTMNLITRALTGEGHDPSEDGTGRGTPLVAFNSTGGAQGDGRNEDICMPLKVGAGEKRGGVGAAAIASPAAVRRLTPLECERLQGFPDGWTCLCQPLEAYAADPDAAALRCTCPDSPRYRALGNAVTVSVVEWLGRRLIAAMP